MSSSPERRLARWGQILSASLLAATLAGGIGLAAQPANPTTQPPTGDPWSKVVSGKDLTIWQSEGGAAAANKPEHPPGYFGIGATPSAAEIAGWSIAVPPDGARLPPGHGTVAAGGQIFEKTCAMCHGSFGEGSNGYPQLVGGVGSLGSNAPEKTAGSYWPYATTLWDYINRAMPFFAPHTLKPDEVYALVAWILNANGIVGDGWIANAHSVPLVKMPAASHWNWKDPRPVTANTACMTNCKNAESVKITSSAAGKKLTPRLTGPLDHMSSGK